MTNAPISSNTQQESGGRTIPVLAASVSARPGPGGGACRHEAVVDIQKHPTLTRRQANVLGEDSFKSRPGKFERVSGGGDASLVVKIVETRSERFGDRGHDVFGRGLQPALYLGEIRVRDACHSRELTQGQAVQFALAADDLAQTR
jgi:hypothetical protein